MARMVKFIVIISFIFLFRGTTARAENILSSVFDFPFGWDPKPEVTSLNGLAEFRMTYKTNVPFEMLKYYYTSFLEESGWKSFELVDYLPNTFFADDPVEEPLRLLFLCEGQLLSMFYIPGENESLFMISLREFKPYHPFEWQEGIKNVRHVDEIEVPGAVPILQFNTESQGNNTLLLVFQVEESPESVMRFFNSQLSQTGWEESPFLKLFQHEILHLFGNNEFYSLSSQMAFYSKENSSLFVFAGNNSDENNLFGYYFRKGNNHPITNGGVLNG